MSANPYHTGVMPPPNPYGTQYHQQTQPPPPQAQPHTYPPTYPPPNNQQYMPPPSMPPAPIPQSAYNAAAPPHMPPPPQPTPYAPTQYSMPPPMQYQQPQPQPQPPMPQPPQQHSLPPPSQYGMPPAVPPANYYGGPPAVTDNGLMPPNAQAQMPSPSQPRPAQYGATSMPIIPAWAVPTHPKHMSMTCAAYPNSAALRVRSQIPFGAVLRALADPPPDQPTIPVINPGAAGVVRCKDCRAYINPYVPWIDGGSGWRCNMCGTLNEVHPTYYAPLDQYGYRVDAMNRVELHCGTVEIIAPVDYMVRQPMPPIYFFLIEASQHAVNSGMLASACQIILSVLDSLPGDKRTLVGFMTFDSTLHYYMLKPGTAQPASFILSDIDDIFVPQPDHLLVNLDESRAEVEALLKSLPSLFAQTRDVENAFGSALEGALQVCMRIGGKVFAILSSMPSLGEGRLINRDNAKLLGTETEHTLLKSADEYYKKRAIQYTRYQMSVDIFAAINTYMDVATLHDLCTMSAGQFYAYHQFNALNPQHQAKLNKELSRALTCSQGWEAVIRVRASKGVSITDFHGNFYLRGTDLLAVPHLDSDDAFTFELRNEEMPVERSVCVQSALLYTTSAGERRIRVNTICLPVTANLLDLYDRIDTNATVNVMCKHAIHSILTESFEKSREDIRNRCVALLRIHRQAISKLPPPVPINPQLNILPLLVLGLLKCTGIREGADVRSDIRAAVLCMMYGMGIVELETFIRPRMLPLTELIGNIGVPSANPDTSGLTEAIDPALIVALPAECSLTAEVLRSDTAHLIDNGIDMFIRLGRQCSPQLLMSLFNIPSLDGVDCSHLAYMIQTPQPNDTTSPLARITAIIRYLRALSPYYQLLNVVVEGDAAEGSFYRMLIEDRSMTAMSLTEFDAFIHRQQGYQ